MTGAQRIGAALAPTGHATIDEARIALETDIGAKSQPFHHSGPEAFDHGVGLFDQPQHRLATFRSLEVNGHRSAATTDQIVFRVDGNPETGCHGTVDAYDLRTHVRQHHGRVRTRSDACELDDSCSGKRSAHTHVAPPEFKKSS